MTQKAIVKQIQDDGTIQISLMRQMECGLSCNNCEGCTQKPTSELLATANCTSIPVQPGDLVEVDPAVIGTNLASLLVFVFPCIGFMIGYLLGKVSGLGDVPSILVSFAIAVISLLPAYAYNSRFIKRGSPEFTVVRVLR